MNTSNRRLPTASLGFALSFTVLATTAALTSSLFGTEPSSKELGTPAATTSLPTTGLSLANAGVAAPATTKANPNRDTYYLSDYLSTTIGTVDAAGKIDQMETDAFGAPLAAGRPPARFTGKPYDEDMGAYIFPFRNYRPDEARWMTPDPSGFPDGVNNRVYMPVPTKGFDRFGLTSQLLADPGGSYGIGIDAGYDDGDGSGGLTFTTDSDPVYYTGESDSSKVQVEFDLEIMPPSASSGWFVQEVSIDLNYATNSGHNVSYSTHYLEAMYCLYCGSDNWELYGPNGETSASTYFCDSFKMTLFGWGSAAKLSYANENGFSQFFSSSYSGLASGWSNDAASAGGMYSIDLDRHSAPAFWSSRDQSLDAYHYLNLSE